MAGTLPKDSMVHYWVQLPGADNGNIAIFEIPITRIERYMTGHCVAGSPLCPASIYLEFVIAGVILTTKHLAKYHDDLHVALSQIHFTKALTSSVSNEGDIVIKVIIDAENGTFRIGSGLSQPERQIIHAHGEYQLQQSTSEMATELARADITSISQVLKPENAHCSESFSARTVYEVIFPRVVKYSKEFQTVQHLVINSDGMEATATITLASVCDRASFVIDPVFLDTLLHVAGFVSNLRGDLHEAYICDAIGFVELLIPSAIESGATFVIHCDFSWSSDKNAILADSYAISDAHPGTAVAHMKGIRFRRVRLSYLKGGLAGSLAVTPSPEPPSCRDIQSPEQKVLQVIARTCDIDSANITLDSGLDRFGIDSLMRLELAIELGRAFPTIGDIQRKVLTCDKVLDVVNMISSENCVVPDNVISEASISDILNLDQKLVSLQQFPGHKMPLVLVHDGSGLAISYRCITDLNRDVWGINNPRFASLGPWKSVIEMAESYAESILETLQGGPLILGGWSFGGVVAFEVAKQLGIKSKLVKVQGVILIDSPNPLNHVPLSLPLIEDVINNSTNVNSDLRGYCKTQFTANAKLLSEYDPYEAIGGGLPIRLVCLVCRDGYKTSSRVDVPSWLADRGDIATITNGWELVSGSPVQWLDIPGHHFEPFQPRNVVGVSSCIAEACEILEKELASKKA